MSRYPSYGAAIAAILAGVTSGISAHRTARVIRFIHRHPQAHRGVIAKLRRRQQEHDRDCDRRFRELQRLPADPKPRHTDPLPWTRRGRRLARAHGRKRGAR